MNLDKKILHLSLKKQWFDLMVSGKKKIEYRVPKPSGWICKRLKKDYDIIKFTNGYGADKPYFICEYNGFEISQKEETVVIEKSTIQVKPGTYMIKLGKILETGNISRY